MIGHYVLTEDVQSSGSVSSLPHCTDASPPRRETNAGGSIMNDDDDDDGGGGSDHDSDVSEQDGDDDDEDGEAANGDDDSDIMTGGVEKSSEAEITGCGMCHMVVKLCVYVGLWCLCVCVCDSLAMCVTCQLCRWKTAHFSIC